MNSLGKREGGGFQGEGTQVGRTGRSLWETPSVPAGVASISHGDLSSDGVRKPDTKGVVD